MTAAEVAYQESLRGATWTPPAAQSTTAKSATVAVAPDGTIPDDASSTTATAEEKTRLVTRRIKARALENKAWQRLDPAGGGWGLFGYHTLPQAKEDRKLVVLTEGEYDAMAVWQATGMPAVSLPNGCRSLPVEVLPLLEDFEKIYLWMDNDGPGQEGAETFSKKLGLGRCFLVRPTLENTGCMDAAQLPIDANEALLRGLDLNAMIADAKRAPHKNIITFGDVEEDVMHEILHPDKYSGVPLPSLPKFTNLIKGIRRGELTVVTGPTGSGYVYY